MITLNARPTREQLKDISFWDNLPPDGVEYDGFEFSPHYAILQDGEPIEFKTDNGKPFTNSFPYQRAVEEVERLSKERDNITLDIIGYHETLIRRDSRSAAKN